MCQSLQQKWKKCCFGDTMKTKYTFKLYSIFLRIILTCYSWGIPIPSNCLQGGWQFRLFLLPSTAIRLSFWIQQKRGTVLSIQPQLVTIWPRYLFLSQQRYKYPKKNSKNCYFEYNANFIWSFHQMHKHKYCPQTLSLKIHYNKLNTTKLYQNNQ